MKGKPYVGITGPVTKEEVSLILNAFSDAGYTMHSPHIPMIGYLVSQKTMLGQDGNRRYPKFEYLKSLLDHAHNRALTMIHYNTQDRITLVSQVEELFGGLYEGGLCRALQLNIVWPAQEHVKEIKDLFPEMEIVFQASAKSMKGLSQKEFVDAVRGYEDSISYVLIDPSGGRGQEFDMGNSLALYQEIATRLPYLTVGFAGGLNWNNTSDKVRSLIEKIGTEDFCIDAEGGLRDKVTDAYGDDILNIEKVKGYLRSASSVLR